MIVDLLLAIVLVVGAAIQFRIVWELSRLDTSPTGDKVLWWIAFVVWTVFVSAAFRLIMLQFVSAFI